MTIERRPFGVTKSGQAVCCYTLSDGEMSAEVLSYGGTLRCLRVPAPEGIRDVVLGFDSVGDYERQGGYVGALIGRVCNRIGGAGFSLDGRRCRLPANEGSNCLHGGFNGFDKRVWEAGTRGDVLTLTLFSPGGDQGFPGNLTVWAEYSLAGGALKIRYCARCGEDTPLGLTSHCYFNLNGHDAGAVDGHEIQIFAGAVTETDAALIPTGKLLAVEGTPLDLREMRPVGGLVCDSNFVLAHAARGEPCLAAALQSGGLRMECLTTEPGLQFYTGHGLSGEAGKGGAIYGSRAGLCLESQPWPDAVNHENFPSCVLRDGAVFSSETVYRFSIL